MRSVSAHRPCVPVALRNPKSPYRADEIEWDGEPPPAELEVYEEDASSIVSRNDSPDLGFEFSVNPYRGCYHGCAYCYARPSHQYLDFGAGTDFEKKLVIKRDAAASASRRPRPSPWAACPCPTPSGSLFQRRVIVPSSSAPSRFSQRH